jgi:acetyl-CoA carboxylase biotin carboxyl carrier protein
MSEVITSPMVGKILDVKVSVGDQVSEGDEVVILEAMKMEMPIIAPVDGTIKAINVTVGQSVESDTAIAEIE